MIWFRDYPANRLLIKLVMQRALFALSLVMPFLSTLVMSIHSTQQREWLYTLHNNGYQSRLTVLFISIFPLLSTIVLRYAYGLLLFV